MAGTQKTKIIKHISKNHNIETEQEKSIKFNINEELEAWVCMLFVFGFGEGLINHQNNNNKRNITIFNLF